MATDFRERGQHAATARSPAKAVTIATAGGRRLSLKGIANFRASSNGGQFPLTDGARRATGMPAGPTYW
jgi:hypothetical protein